MKKYISTSVKWMAVFSVITVLMFVAGLVFFAVDFHNISLSIGLAVGGFFLSLISVSVFFTEKSRTVVIDEEKVVFPRGAEINGKLSFKKTVINMNDVASIESQFQKGDKIITGDCYFHTLKLKDGTKVTLTLYAYGKKAEKEIIEIIKSNIT